ncbi:bile acid:sodium symporter [Adhaeribacter sp. BT258]|uniref:Bile acid:sodium symporter n=1 Tax=Adhaeribacter terrigena TaxID=2793070 RepID=A0ABS1C3N7_9BACT|nr:bile acid:sodium symporter [Adhaeribacter terrigena]MBK0403965.1 bile acid:sodium symporter [Adhaeribacter terrigena]
MFEVLIKISATLLPVFVFLTMFNVGLTQQVSDILYYFRDRKFALLMLVANFVFAPLLMWAILYFFPTDPYLSTGLAIFSLCAGAPFLIKLTQEADHELALGASTMIKLILGTVVIVPLVLPRLISEIEIDGFKIAWTLIKQLILPIILGLLVAKFLPKITGAMQPWVAKIGNWVLYLVIFSTLAGYFPELKGIWGEGAILIGIVFVLGAFGIGYFMGGLTGEDNLQDVGALGTAQRNTAASMIIAAENFANNPEVLVIITIANTIGIAMLLMIAKMLSKDNKIKVIYPDRKMGHQKT